MLWVLFNVIYFIFYLNGYLYILVMLLCYVCIVINMWGNINSSTVDTTSYMIFLSYINLKTFENFKIFVWEHSQNCDTWHHYGEHLNSHDQTMLTHHFYRLFNFMHYKFSCRVFFLLQKINKMFVEYVARQWYSFPVGH